MKKHTHMLRLVYMLLILVLLFSFSACDSNDNVGANEESNMDANEESNLGFNEEINVGVDEEINVGANVENIRYSATSVDQMNHPNYEEVYSFYDDDYYYYLFYLGCIDHVPLTQQPGYEYKGTPHEKELSTNVTEATTVSKMISDATSKCVTDSMEYNSNLTVGNEDTILKLELGIAKIQSTAFTTSREQSITTAASYSKSYTDTTKFVFTDESKIGYYRYVLFGDIDVFGVLVIDPDSGEYYSGTYEIIAAYYYSLDYSETARFDDNNYDNLIFALSESEIASLEKPTIYIDNPKDIEPTDKDDSNPVVKYDSGYSAKEIDATYEYTHDIIDLSKLSAFMTSDYTLHFTVEVYMREAASGYQEIYICRDDETHVAGTDAYEYGGPGKACTSYSWVTFDWYVDGSQCTKTMVLRYGAHGDDSDDWWRAHVKVTVTAEKK